MLQGASNEEKIFNFLIGHGFTIEGACGTMGNLYAEAGFRPENLQNTGEKKLGTTDAAYTAGVDNGSYTNFIHDGFGYGLCQWTYWSRKQSLLNYKNSKNVSIADLEMQLEFLLKELNNYSGLLSTLKTTHDLQTASDEFLMKFERPASVLDPNSQSCKDTKAKRLAYSQTYLTKYKKGETTMQKFTNSPLISATLISPNKTSPRNHDIDRITIHCFVGQVTVQRGLDEFKPSSKNASCNYVVAKDGKIGLCVEEKDRSWCSSSSSNDHRAITIETASDTKSPYAVTDAAFNALLDLCTDICQRNGKTKMVWIPDKTRALAYVPASGEIVMTLHRYFKNKSCPGPYLEGLHATIADEVNRRLAGQPARTINPSTGNTSGSSKPSTPSQPSTPPSSSGEMYRVRKSWKDAASQVGAYTVLQNAIDCANQHPGYVVFNSAGNQVYPEIQSQPQAPSQPQGFVPYVVEVSIPNLNIRKGPGTNYAKTGKYTGKGRFTIVEENGSWGRLKSGLGWINLDYTKRV